MLDEPTDANFSSGEAGNPRVNILSLRNIEKLVARTVNFEFEDLIGTIDVARVLSPQPQAHFTARRKVAHRLWRHLPYPVNNMNPGVGQQSIQPECQLFVAVCMNAWDLVYLNSLSGWKQHTGIKVCWIDEIWENSLDQFQHLLPILSNFDAVFIGCRGTVEALQKRIKAPCYYMPPGVDAMKFCPFPDPPQRSIDVYSIGRRSEITHQALLHQASQDRLFYIYDTTSSSDMKPRTPSEHRQLVASMAKRSRFFIANTAKINCHSETRGQNEVGFRFFEGAASGAVMIGQPPEVSTFDELFGWPDAVIPMEFDRPDAYEFLMELESQPQRLDEARKNNVVQSLLRHDWAWRWKAILETVGLPPMPALVARERRLRLLADTAAAAHDSSLGKPALQSQA